MTPCGLASFHSSNLATSGDSFHASSRQTYGAPRIHADLRGRGERHSRKRIARLMREAGLVGASHRHGGPITTRRDKDARLAPDLVDRDFSAAGTNQRWVADTSNPYYA
jgi:putative transposase